MLIRLSSVIEPCTTEFVTHGSVTPDPRLHSRPQSTATAPWPEMIFCPTEDRRLSLPEWLVKYMVK